MRENTAGPAEPIYGSRNSVEPKLKHSALASLLWQYVDELENSSQRLICGKPENDDAVLAARIALGESAIRLRVVLEKNYGPREPK